MTSVDSPTVSLVLEWIDPDVVGVDPDSGAIPDLMMWSLLTLGACAQDPSNTRLVVTGNFVESAKARMDSEFHREKFDMIRGSGVVAAKTMPMPDGSVDVLVPYFCFADPNQTADAALLVKRTIVHEGQHVAIAQAGEVGGDFAVEPWARRNFLTAANEILEEYRAELAVGPELRSGDSGWDLIELLDDARVRLKNIACVEYQEHLDVGKLSYDVLSYVHTVWKVLAYVAANDAVASAATAEVVDSGATVASDDLWKRMAAPQWKEFCGALALVPSGTKRATRAVLDPLVEMLADILSDWLKTLGFQFKDRPEGAEFLIESWDLLLD